MGIQRTSYKSFSGQGEQPTSLPKHFVARAWRKKIEEKQEKLVLKEELRELKEELLALLNTKHSTTKAEQGTENKANLFYQHVLVSAAYFVSGFFACYLFLSNFQ